MSGGNLRLGDPYRNRPKGTREGYLAKITIVLGSRNIFVGRTRNSRAEIYSGSLYPRLRLGRTLYLT